MYRPQFPTDKQYNVGMNEPFNYFNKNTNPKLIVQIMKAIQKGTNTIRNISGCFFLFIGIFGCSKQPILGLVFISWGVLLLPILNKLAASKGWRLNSWTRIIIVFIGCILINIFTPQAKEVTTDATPTSTPTSPTTTSSSLTYSKDIKQSKYFEAKPEENNFEAIVHKKGLDFSFEATGKVKESSQSVILTYNQSWDCSAESTVDMTRQEWKVIFDLPSKTWTDQVKEETNCAYAASQEWIDVSKEPSQFSLETIDGRTIIRADKQDTDGSIILKDMIVVEYRNRKS
jgi:hypothetical protein